VQVVEDMPAEDVMEAGDRITAVNDMEINDAEELTEYVQNQEAGDQLYFTINRDGETLEEQVEVADFEEEDKVGIGIQLVTDEEIDVTPTMDFNSGKIGGPSAGLMFSLEIYNQLLEEDITKGYNIVGTGEIDYDGGVHPIG